VKGFADRSGIRVEVKIGPKLGHLCHEMEFVLFRVVQESLANVLRHSGSADVMVEIRRESGRLKLTVVDHGNGIRSLPMGQIRTPSVGIAGMRERVEQLGGTLHVTFSSKGTTVSAIFAGKFCTEGGACENCVY
jgi:signal transduction histidine kinase